MIDLVSLLFIYLGIGLGCRMANFSSLNMIPDLKQVKTIVFKTSKDDRKILKSQNVELEANHFFGAQVGTAVNFFAMLNKV